MHARRLVYPTIGHWAVQAALGVTNICTLKVKCAYIMATFTLMNYDNDYHV